MFGPAGVPQRIEPRGWPGGAVRLGQRLDRTPRFVDRRAGETRQKGQGRGAEAELEQAAPAGRLEVVVPLRHRPRDERDFPRVEPEVAIELGLRWGPCVRVRQVEFGRTGVE